MFLRAIRLTLHFFSNENINYIFSLSPKLIPKLVRKHSQLNLVVSSCIKDLDTQGYIVDTEISSSHQMVKYNTPQIPLSRLEPLEGS